VRGAQADGRMRRRDKCFCVAKELRDNGEPNLLQHELVDDGERIGLTHNRARDTQESRGKINSAQNTQNLQPKKKFGSENPPNIFIIGGGV